jgi:hypothetical protein
MRRQHSRAGSHPFGPGPPKKAQRGSWKRVRRLSLRENTPRGVVWLVAFSVVAFVVVVLVIIRTAHGHD